MARYDWPSSPVLNPDEASKRMGEAMKAAWGDLEVERIRVAESLTMGRKALVDKTLKEFQAAIDQFELDVAYHLERFATLHLAPQYLEGVKQGGGLPVWTGIHSQAFAALAVDTYGDFLKRSQVAEQTSRAFASAVRRAARDELPKIAGGGRTAKQAASRMEERLINQYGITHVTYRDGARVPVDQYSRMAARTKSAVAYNSGTLNEVYANGGEYVEVFDGADCGWTDHGSPDKANGTIRTLDEAAMSPISHPNCTRAFGPRPDVTSLAQAKKAQPSTTADQRQDQEAIDWNPAQQAMTDRTRMVSRARRQTARASRIDRITGGRGVTTVESLAEDLVARGRVAEPAITAALKRSVAARGGELDRLGSALKDEVSTARKLLGDAAEKLDLTVTEAATILSDVVRYTAVLPEARYWQNGQALIDDLTSQGHLLAKQPAGWNAVGYKGRNVKMKSPLGQPYELQIHTRASVDGAEDAHGLLNAQRESKSLAEFDDFNTRMNAIFAAVPVPPGTPLL